MRPFPSSCTVAATAETTVGAGVGVGVAGDAGVGATAGFLGVGVGGPAERSTEAALHIGYGGESTGI